MIAASLDLIGSGTDVAQEAQHGLSVRLSAVTDHTWSQWRALEQRIGEVPLAASSGWTEAWIRTYGAQLQARVAVAEQAGKVRGICLVCESTARRAGPIRLRTLHFGTAGEAAHESACVEYNAVLVEPRWKTAFCHELTRLAMRQRQVDEWHLDGFDAETARTLGDVPGMEWTQRPCWYFDLESARTAGSDVMSRLGRNTRSALRRALKKSGALEMQLARGLDEAVDIFSELVDLHQARWRAAGQPGAFASPRFLAFQRELIERLLPERRLVLLRVRNPRLTIGCLMLLVDRGRLLDYLSGFAPFDAAPSPGIVTHYLAMEYGLAEGFRAYDFLVGDKRHKANLATDTQDLVWGVWRRPGIKNSLIQTLRSAKRIATELVARRRTPVPCADTGETVE